MAGWRGDQGWKRAGVLVEVIAAVLLATQHRSPVRQSASIGNLESSIDRQGYSALFRAAARNGDRKAMLDAYQKWLRLEESAGQPDERRIGMMKGRLGVMLAENGKLGQALPYLTEAAAWRSNRGGAFSQDWTVTFWLHKAGELTGSQSAKALALAQVVGEIDLGYGTFTTVEELESQGVTKLETMTYMAGMLYSSDRFRGGETNPAKGYAMMSGVVDAHRSHALLNFGACKVFDDEAKVRAYAARAYRYGDREVKESLLESFGPRREAALAERRK